MLPQTTGRFWAPVHLYNSTRRKSASVKPRFSPPAANQKAILNWAGKAIEKVEPGKPFWGQNWVFKRMALDPRSLDPWFALLRV